MARRTTGWSTSSFRDGSDGYVPGPNQDVYYNNNTAYVRDTGYTEYRDGCGIVPGSANPPMPYNAPFYNNGPYDRQFNNNGPFNSHVDVGYSSTSHRSSGGGIGQAIADTIQSTFGGKSKDVGYAGTSTRSSFPDDNNYGSGGFGGSGTSFR